MRPPKRGGTLASRCGHKERVKQRAGVRLLGSPLERQQRKGKKMSSKRVTAGTRVKGLLTGSWYTVTVSANLDESGAHAQLTSGMVRRDGDPSSVACSRSNPILISHIEVQ